MKGQSPVPPPPSPRRVRLSPFRGSANTLRNWDLFPSNQAVIYDRLTRCSGCRGGLTLDF